MVGAAVTAGVAGVCGVGVDVSVPPAQAESSSGSRINRASLFINMVSEFYHPPQIGPVYYNNPMIELLIPGRGTLRLEHLVCDVNGTLALDGRLLEGVAKALADLKDRLEVHLLTADTHGHQELIDQQLGLTAVRLHPGDEIEQKAAFVRHLGAEAVAAIGQGANDAAMLHVAALGIAILSVEGLAVSTLTEADLLMPDILSALDLFTHPLRLTASLRC